MKNRFRTALPLSLLTVLLCFAHAQQKCPISISKVYSRWLCSGDPWATCLRLEYSNTTDRAIGAVHFGVYFVDDMNQAHESIYKYDEDRRIKPGQKRSGQWGDGVYYNEYGSQMRVMAWVSKIRFEDGSTWADDGSRSCGNVMVDDSQVSSVSSNLSIPALAQNIAASRSSPAAAASIANEGHELTQEELAALVAKGEASRCGVVTVPSGAEIYIDGNKAGISPLGFTLIKHGSTPRVVTLKLSGYKTIEKSFVPDGKTIPISAVLQKAVP